VQTGYNYVFVDFGFFNMLRKHINKFVFRSIDLCMTDCTSCDRVWLMALKSNVGAQSTYNDFEKIGYPYYDSSYGER